MRAPHIKHSAKHALLVNMLDAKKSLFDNDGNPRPALTNALDTVLRLQRPLALSMVKKPPNRYCAALTGSTYGM